ncbi:alpha/beta hydrolase family protein [Glacieibacterium frigidum]|nr:Mbeg1-like protein [Glacieibacterium frigidum]
MIQSISSSRPIEAGSVPELRQTTADRFAADWAAPSATRAASSAAPQVAATRGAEGGSIPASTVRTQESALLAADVYRDTPTPPTGFRVASADDLSRLGIAPEQLERAGSSFRARVYVTGSGETERFVVAFRGSSSGEDWRNNFQQAAGANSQSYTKALIIGEALARSDASVTIAGHSLGGGLASATAVASGREADTFNAAGLTDKTIDRAQAISAANGRGGGDVAVQAYQVPGEILSYLQDGGDRVLGAVLFGVPGALLADAPSAYGSRHELPDVAPEGKNWFERHSRIDRHMIDWVVAGAGSLR